MTAFPLPKRAKKFARTLIGERGYIKYREFRTYLDKCRMESKFKVANLIDVRVGNIVIQSPKDHLISWTAKSQPYRDLAMGITAKYVSQKYPGETIIDIGANIGDTAAMIASYSSNPLVLVEPSDYFYNLLVKNARHIPNVKRIEKCFVSDKKVLRGTLRHWSIGSARFDPVEYDQAQEFASMTLEEISEGNASFVKIDTDGYDFSIIRSGIEWLSRVQPLLYYENEIRDLNDLNQSNEVLENLSKVGYDYFIVWDDPGFHIASTTDLDVLFKLNRYLLKIWTSNWSKCICNYDMLCVPARDKDIFQAVTKYYMEY